MCKTTIQAVLSALVMKGATVETRKQDSGYDSTCSYGTPTRPGAKPTESDRYERDSYIVHKVTGVSWVDIRDAFGAADAWQSERSEGIEGALVYYHPRITEANGAGGRGIVVAIGFRKEYGSEEATRGCPHISTKADGSLRVGRFG